VRIGRHLPRLLHARSQFGYTPRTTEALNGEPEAVSAEEQRRLTRQAQQSQQQQEAERARVAVEQITDGLQALSGIGSLDSQVRAMRRQLAQVQRRLQR